MASQYQKLPFHDSDKPAPISELDIQTPLPKPINSTPLITRRYTVFGDASTTRRITSNKPPSNPPSKIVNEEAISIWKEAKPEIDPCVSKHRESLSFLSTTRNSELTKTTSSQNSVNIKNSEDKRSRAKTLYEKIPASDETTNAYEKLPPKRDEKSSRTYYANIPPMKEESEEKEHKAEQTPSLLTKIFFDEPKFPVPPNNFDDIISSLMDANRFIEALEKINNLVGRNGELGFLRLYEYRAMCLKGLARYEEAIPDFLKVLKGREVVKEDIMLQYHFAFCLKETEQHELALKVIEAILAMKPDHFHTLVLKGELLRAEGRELEGLALLRRAIQRPDLMDTTLVARVQEIINRNPEEESPSIKRNKLDKAKDKLSEAKGKLVGAKDKIKDRVRGFSKGLSNSNEKLDSPSEKVVFRDRSKTIA